jgi:prophage regulatory protein
MPDEPRFMTLPEVAAELAVSQSQMYALVKSGDLPAIQVGGRGQWRVERVKLEEYIARMYEQAENQRGKLKPEDTVGRAGAYLA